MSEKLYKAKVRSASDGELIDGNDDFHNEDDSPDEEPARIFTLPRSSSRRKSHKKIINTPKMSQEFLYPDEKYSSYGNPKKKRFRKPSMKSVGNFLNKMIRQMTATGSHPTHTRHINLERQRRESFSASSTDVRSHCSTNELSKNKTPGITGLRNHGNTCFMNAVLQCICHTDILAEYFVMDQYKIDLTRRNKNNSRKYGTRGEVTEQLALLLKSLWSCQYTPEISNQFKTVVGKYESQYLGSNQHDAQEFLLWLLDRVHEDLNTATKKKYKKIKNSHGRPEEMVAAEALANHMRCNNSFVHDLFHALYRSSLTCPKCQSRSITFDPFLCVSIPIPQRHFHPVFVTVVYLNQQPKQVKLGLNVNSQGTIRELRETLASDTGIPSDRFILAELVPEGFHHTFDDNQPISIIKKTDDIYAIEVPPLRPVDAKEGEYLLLIWLNRLGIGCQGKRFSCPFTKEVPREISYEELQKTILKTMSNILHEDALKEDVETVFKLRVVDGIPGKGYLPTDVDHPLYMPTVDKALGCNSPDQGCTHLKLIVEWNTEMRDKFVTNRKDIIEEHSSVKQLKNQESQPATATLHECFELYTQEEKLGPEDTWMCPSCKQLRQGVKELGLWSVPDILVLHMKRFRQTPTQRTKLETLVEFPITGLDMSPHIVGPPPINHHFHANGFNSFSYWSPWRRHHRGLSRREDNLFDLYAVCNHHGNMQGGHYTAYCKNPTDGCWYLFDDTKVQKLDDDSSIVSPNAYILFYQRSTLFSSGSSASSSSSSSGGSEHWVYRMPSFHFASPKFSKSQDNLSTCDGQEENNVKTKLPTAVRGNRLYSSMSASLGSHKHTQEPLETEPAHHSDDEESYSKMYITESCV